MKNIKIYHGSAVLGPMKSIVISTVRLIAILTQRYSFFFGGKEKKMAEMQYMVIH